MHSRLAACAVVGGVALSTMLMGVSAHGAGATTVPTRSTWIPVAPKQVRIVGAAVVANRGLIVTASTQEVATPEGTWTRLPNLRALVVQRNGRSTRVIRRVTLPEDIGSVTAVTADSRGRWFVLSVPMVNGIATYDTGRLTRLTAQGVVDKTFGTGGASSISGSPLDVVSDSAGRAVVLTSRSTLPLPGTSETLVTRLTTAGMPDATFGSRGWATVPAPIDRAAAIVGAPASSLSASTRTLAVTPTNGIVVAGTISDVTTGSIGYLAKLTPSGLPDGLFGNGDGTVTYGPFRNDPLNAGAFGAAVSVTHDQRISVVGRPNGTDRDLTWRRTARGLRDASYGTRGWFRPATPDSNMQGTATIQGSALCNGGFVQTTPGQIRITTRLGRADRSYGHRGVIAAAAMSPLRSIDAAAADVRPCPTNYLAASARVSRGKGGVTLIWLSLPPPRALA